MLMGSPWRLEMDMVDVDGLNNVIYILYLLYLFLYLFVYLLFLFIIYLSVCFFWGGESSFHRLVSRKIQVACFPLNHSHGYTH